MKSIHSNSVDASKRSFVTYKNVALISCIIHKLIRAIVASLLNDNLIYFLIRINSNKSINQRIRSVWIYWYICIDHKNCWLLHNHLGHSKTQKKSILQSFSIKNTHDKKMYRLNLCEKKLAMMWPTVVTS